MTTPSAEAPARPCCPRCGGRVCYGLTCHTWPQRRDDGTEAWMSCLPCDSAIEYACAGQYRDGAPAGASECDWRYTHGLNPRNPRSAENEANRPPWIPEGWSVNQRHGGPDNLPLVLATAVPGVPMLGEDGDD